MSYAPPHPIIPYMINDWMSEKYRVLNCCKPIKSPKYLNLGKSPLRELGYIIPHHVGCWRRIAHQGIYNRRETRRRKKTEQRKYAKEKKEKDSGISGEERRLLLDGHNWTATTLQNSFIPFSSMTDYLSDSIMCD